MSQVGERNKILIFIILKSSIHSVEWLSLDSALFYNLEGLGFLPNLTLLRLNYKSRPIDQTVVDFFSTSCHNLSVLHLFDVKDIHMDDLRLTVGQCKVSWDVALIEKHHITHYFTGAGYSCPE